MSTNKENAFILNDSKIRRNDSEMEKQISEENRLVDDENGMHPADL